MTTFRHSTTERHGALLEHLSLVGEASIADLSRDLGVSQVSIRRDLEYLAARNLLRRTRGGAQSLTQPGQVSVFDARLRTNLPVKAAIGALRRPSSSPATRSCLTPARRCSRWPATSPSR